VTASGSEQVGSRTRARPSDLRRLYALLEEASVWLRHKGLAQWNPVYPLYRFTREIEQGNVWYWETAGQPVATVTLLSSQPDYYPAGVWDDSSPAWYLCRFTVKRAWRGQGLGERLLHELGTDAGASGIRSLRLDVGTANPFLESYYVARGFVRRGVVAIHGEPSVILEKPLK
jgi:GNAT superfamily N-acetyltransferase